MPLIGRVKECTALDDLLASARQGMSSAIVLHGEPGVGKSALVGHAAESALDFRILRIAGVEAEHGLPFAGLQRLLMPLHDGIARLIPRQRSALSVAIGTSDGAAGDTFLVGLATLSVLAEAATRGPLLVCVDDVHWLDGETVAVLAFVARRMFAEGVVMVLAVRSDQPELTALESLAHLEIVGLDPPDALQLLHETVRRPVDARIADRVVVATAGNPLAITDLGSTLSSQQLVGGTILPEPIPVGATLEAHYLHQVRRLPTATQTWLLIAAAEPGGDIGYISDAASVVAVASDASAPAELLGMVKVDRTVEFRHPLIRSAIYNGAPSTDRRRVHHALAAVTVRPGDEDRGAWHLAAAATGPDDAVAAALEASAEHAGDRGGYAARSRYLARAAELTADPMERSRRLVAAAQASLAAGALLQGRRLLEDVVVGTRSRSTYGDALLTEASIAFALGEPGAFATAPATCLAAAKAYGPDDPQAIHALFSASRHAIPAEHLIAGTTVDEIAETVVATGADRAPGAVGLVLKGFAALALEGYESAVPHLRRAIDTLVDDDSDHGEALELYIVAVTFCTVLWDDQSRSRLHDNALGYARRQGALQMLDTALFSQSMAETTLGDIDAADRSLVEGHMVRTAIGASPDQWEIYRHPELLAWHGENPTTPALIQAAEDGATALGIGAVVSIARIGRVTLGIAAGRYAEACALARSLVENDPLSVHSRVLPDLIEAAVRTGDADLARRSLATLTTRATASATPWALGLLARSTALLADGDDAEAHYRDAVNRLSATAARSDCARAHLLYGEWLRRTNRRRDARQQLYTALTHFEDMGAADFAERTRRELSATGETARKRTVDTQRALTPQEEQIARLAASGHTNAEIGERLFISARTVDYHLRKVYQKLGIGSRRHLRDRYRETTTDSATS